MCVFVCVTPYLENRALGFLKHCTMSYLSDDKIFQVDKLKIYLQIIGDCCQICTKSKIFYSPALTAVVTYGLPFIHLLVCLRQISKSVCRNFLTFSRNFELPNATEVIFSDFPEKSHFVPFLANLGPKMPFLAF